MVLLKYTIASQLHFQGCLWAEMLQEDVCPHSWHNELSSAMAGLHVQFPEPSFHSVVHSLATMASGHVIMHNIFIPRYWTRIFIIYNLNGISSPMRVAMTNPSIDTRPQPTKPTIRYRTRSFYSHNRPYCLMSFCRQYFDQKWRVRSSGSPIACTFTAACTMDWLRLPNTEEYMQTD